MIQEIEKKMDKQQVEKRVRDWKKRVNELYSTIKVWLKDTEYSVKPGPKLKMYEELMYHYDVPAIDIETVDIYRNKNFVLAMKPKGLWIIGVNGGIDILSTKGSYYIADSAEQFEPPKWRLYKKDKDKKNGLELNENTFIELLNLI